MKHSVRSLCLAVMVAGALAGCDLTVVDELKEKAAADAQPDTTQVGASTTAGKIAGGVIAGQYIVVFGDGITDVAGLADRLARAHGGTVLHTYEHALKGFAVQLSAPAAEALGRNPNVAYVEPDREVQVVEQSIPNGIIKTGAYASSALAGDGIEQPAVLGVNVYVIDTGVDAGHADLKVVDHVNFARGPNKDCHGHGTHVAGTVAARDNTIDVVGMAPGAPITGVKVLDCAGSGSTSGVIKGVDWVTKNAVKPAVANMSLGGGASKSLDDAVRNSASSGIFYAVAAGNSADDACQYSPARAGKDFDGIMTVAAVDANGVEASFSNYGLCVDVWAPGVGVGSTKLGGGFTTMSGTSMSSPHVAGGGAVYLSTKTMDGPATVEQAIKAVVQKTGTLSKDGREITRLYIASF